MILLLLRKAGVDFTSKGKAIFDEHEVEGDLNS